MDFDKVAKLRHSVRHFSTRKVDWRDIMKAIDLARLAPLAGNIPTLKFLIISDEEKISRLAEASQQEFISEARFVVVVCSTHDQLTRSYDERGLKYSKQQAGAAIQNFLLKLTELGLATCWIGAFSDEEVKRILQISDDVEVEALFPIGYELGKGKQKPKPLLEQCVYFNTWKNKYMEPWKDPRGSKT
ncbi:MAG: nitroreductase family protein [Candidatus Pacearchaeota archaeon]|nr:nitroreductase family protein [Candidatus Pacearchaeota archaeon]